MIFQRSDKEKTAKVWRYIFDFSYFANAIIVSFSQLDAGVKSVVAA
ncbi:hypothetical protein [Colwellia sp. TT2012]|nr:hypothetical protein [Colwellia sp. TT2012]